MKCTRSGPRAQIRSTGGGSGPTHSRVGANGGAAGGEGTAEPSPETAECVREWTAGADTLSQLVTLYAIEAAQPAISRVKREGLVSSYGFTDGDGTAYFRVHESRDAEHAAQAR